MIYKYEMACREAGLSEENIREIDRMFDADKKKLKRKRNAQKEEHERNGFGIYSLSGMHGQDEEDDFDPTDPDMDVENAVIHAMDMEKLQLLLAEFSEEDRELILAFHCGIRGAKKQAADRMGLDKRQARRRAAKLLAILREGFGIEEDAE